MKTNKSSVVDEHLKTERKLLSAAKRNLPELKALLASVSDHWHYEDPIYRLYHESFKVLHAHAIIEKYYGNYEKGKDYVALTNIVKCNNTSTNDTTADQVKDHCINQLGVIWKEIALLCPKRVVFYTNTSYDKYIRAYMPQNCARSRDIANTRIKIGNKTTPWWHRRFLGENNEIICDFLRLGHPQMMRKLDYVDAVVKWLNETKNSLSVPIRVA